MTTSLPRSMLADLKRSGLTAADAERLALEYIDAEQVERLLRASVAAYRIPYLNVSGAPTGYYRLKLLGEHRDKSGKAIKYWQPAGSAPRFYYPPLGAIKWSDIAKNTAAPLYIVEGEKKAAALCRLDVPAIGIGGVWNWRADNNAIDDFNVIDWRGRTVRIVFDSDIGHKTNVQQALRALANELIKRGAIPVSVKLPPVNGLGKTGADDFLVRRGSGAKAKEAFLALGEEPLLVPRGYTFAEIAEKKLPVPRWAVRDLIPVGLTELAGKPKIGKSWLALDLTTAVASGGTALGCYPTERGSVLHLALEDTERRFQDRLKRVLDGVPAPTSGFFYPRWPRVEENGLDALRRWLDQHDDTRLVIVDTLARLRVSPSGNGNLYHEDYSAIGQLKTIADDYGIAIVVVHHLRKAASDDPLDLVSGSTGLTGAADTILVLRRERTQADATLYVTGRDVSEQEIALQLDQRSMRWKALGEAAHYRMNNERRKIVDALRALGRSASPSDIAQAINKKRAAVQRLMLKMANEGDLRWLEGGRYELTEGVKNEKIIRVT